jgi:polyferredoxin
MLIGFISSTIITIVAVLAWVISHHPKGIEFAIFLFFAVYHLPIIFLVSYPVLMLPFLVKLRLQIFFTIVSLIGAAVCGYIVSQQPWAQTEPEGIRVFIILALAIIVNSAIALGLKWED